MKKIYALFVCSLLFLWGLYANADTAISTDMTNAYRWAYNYWITSLPLEKARLNEPVTRQAAAKMIVKFSINALGKTPDYSKSCNFSDPDIVSDLIPYVQKSCQLGLMGQNATSFNPYGNLTIAQFGTILSRILWWETYAWTSPYYVGHLRALQEYGILKSYGDPTTTFVTRWDVLTLLQKSYTVLVSSREAAKEDPLSELYGLIGNNSSATEYDFRNAHVIAKLTESGSVDVLESYQTYFSKEETGITRKLPQSFKVWDKVYNVLIEDVDVADRPFKATSNGSEVLIAIWDKEEPVKGTQIYSLAYSEYGLINDYAWKGYTQLYWDILPQSFDTNVKSITAEIMFPKPYPELRAEDVLITINWKTSTADSLNWRVDLSANRVVITYTKWVSAFQGMNVVVKFPKSDYFKFDPEKQKSLVEDDFFGSYTQWDSAFSWADYNALVERIKKLNVKDDSHLYDLLKLEEIYNANLESLSGSIDKYVDSKNLDKEDPKVVVEALENAKKLQLDANKEYKTNLTSLKSVLNENDEKYNLSKRIDETLEYLELSDGYVDALMEILIPLYSDNAKYSNWTTSEDNQNNGSAFSLFSLSMTYNLRTESYNTYLVQWATDVYKLVSKSDTKITKNLSTSKVFSTLQEDNELMHGSAELTGVDYFATSTINSWYEEPRNEFKEDWRYKDFRDFTNVNLELAIKLREMKLHATSCPNVYSQQVADDGTYNKKKLYFWNNDKKTMTLMEWIYFVYDCADYDHYAFIDTGDAVEDDLQTITIWK